MNPSAVADKVHPPVDPSCCVPSSACLGEGREGESEAIGCSGGGKRIGLQRRHRDQPGNEDKNANFLEILLSYLSHFFRHRFRLHSYIDMSDILSQDPTIDDLKPFIVSMIPPPHQGLPRGLPSAKESRESGVRWDCRNNRSSSSRDRQ